MDLSISAAFIAGVLSFFSPCVLPIVPGYLGYLGSLGQVGQNTTAQNKAASNASPNAGGANIAEMSKRFRLVMASLFFVAGFVTVFLLIGVSSTAIGSIFARHLTLFQQVAGGMILIMGLHFLGLLRFGFIDRDMRFMPNFKSGGVVSSYIVGLAFGFGWTPCVGPVLASIFLVVAGTTEGAEGMMLLLAYGLGIGVPFIAVAAFADAFTKRFKSMSKAAPVAKYVLGGLMVATGVVMVTGQLNAIGFWMLRTFTTFQVVG